MLKSLLDTMAKRFKHIPDIGTVGLFLSNGSRFYVDYGGHPEMTTPECSNPWDAVRYVKAGEAILADVAEQMTKEIREVREALFFRCNVDYSGPGATWGCHESYLYRNASDHLASHLIPHLVSRIIYTGSGGFNSLASRLEFTLSPRVFHLFKDISPDSTSGRGIFHTKDETLSKKGYHRLHLICGESLCSEISAFLKMGTTALILVLIDAGIPVGHSLDLLNSLEAMRTIARNENCDARVPLADGRQMTAIEIQRHYLQQVESYLQASFMPSWADVVCRHWRRILNRLENGPDAVSTCLDWAIKRMLFKNYVEQQGMEWENLSAKNVLLSTSIKENSDIPLPCLLNPKKRQRGEVPPPSFNGKFKNLCQQLFEIDIRFGQLGDRGIFSQLSETGMLNHQLCGVNQIDQAKIHPPESGRAWLRGKYILRYSGNKGRYICDWKSIYDLQEKQILDLSDPFETKERFCPVGDSINMDDLIFRREFLMRRSNRSRPAAREEENVLPNIFGAF